MNLYRTKPDTEGKRAVLLRSRLLTEFKWTPKRDIASYKKGEPCILPAGEEISGFPYSSTEISDKFITENISFETFLSMIPNPDSALYNKNYGGGYNGKIWTYCGIVCNGLVRFSYNIQRRVYEHKNELINGFTKKYHIHKLVYLEETKDINEAIHREKQLKGWTRNKKIALINEQNPTWSEIKIYD